MNEFNRMLVTKEETSDKTIKSKNWKQGGKKKIEFQWSRDSVK